MDHQLWKGINKDILDLIFKYYGRLKKRNGVYMNQISRQDERYKLLHSIPRKEFFGSSLHSRREFMINNTNINETFVYFRHKRYENNKYFTIYFEEQLDPPYKITHRFVGCYFTNVYSFILP